MKKFQSSIIVSIIILVAFGIGLYFLLRNNIPVIETQVGPVDESLIEEQTYFTPTQYAVFDVKYPQFKNASAEFNKKISDVVTAAISGHAEISEDNWKSRYETQSPGENIPQFPTEGEKYSFGVSWNQVQINDKYISTLLFVSGYEGGAHGYQNILSFNYDVSAQREMTLADLFPDNPDYLKKVSDFSRTALTTDFRERLEVGTSDEDEKNFQEGVIPMMMDGTEPIAQNFSVFTFTPDTITIYFTQYQVAPYAMGESSVVIPRN